MLKKLSTAIALGLVVGVLSIPATSFAGKGANNGDGIPNCFCGEINEDGICVPYELTSTKGNFDVAAGQNGNQTGDRVGDGVPDQDRLQDGSCLENELSTQGNFDVAAGPNGPKGDGIPDLECAEGDESLNPACVDA
jgi:hypothetical protein